MIFTFVFFIISITMPQYKYSGEFTTFSNQGQNDNEIKQDVHSISTHYEHLANKEQSIETNDLDALRQTLLLMETMVHTINEYERDFKELNTFVKSIQGEMANLNKEVNELKEQLVTLQNTKPCDKSKTAMVLEVISSVISKIKLNIFSLPLLHLQQIFNLF
ncbi:hypothetical protein XELAEV_18026680mg [Xenopus laevis]|uniref:Uncharacterized protein n=1 Tax=Xenopus laevis TaxID=8355 RepID=A0A974CU69_XENLA|nr:hypothetical protein XELAEV_18026680mg [Xenopus laevis]